MPWLLLLLGCGDLFEEPVPPSPLGELSGDEVIWYAPLTEAPAPPLPGMAALPGSPEGLPPIARDALVGRICRGRDPAVVDALAERIAREEGSPGQPWTSLLLDECREPGPGLCDALDARFREKQPPLDFADEVLWHAAGSCEDPKLWDWLPREGGSLFGVVDFLVGQDNRFRPITEDRVPQLVAPMLQDDDLHSSYAQQALGAMDHPEAARRLLAAADTDPGAAIWLYRQSDPTARSRFRAACDQWPDAWQCGEGLDPLADLRATVSASNTDLTELLVRFDSHRSAILDALAECLDQGVRGQEAQGGRCLRALVGAGEEARAKQVIHDVGWVDPSWRMHKKAWEELGGATGIGAHLQSEGLLPEDWTPLDPKEPPVWVVDFFVEANRGHAGATISNVELLRRLLAEVPELADARVAGRTWSPAIETRGAERDELLVWLDGTRHRGLAHMGELDGRRVAGIANSLARARDADVRFVVVAPGETVLFGPEDALRNLVDAGYVELVERTRAPYAELGSMDDYGDFDDGVLE